MNPIAAVALLGIVGALALAFSRNANATALPYAPDSWAFPDTLPVFFNETTGEPETTADNWDLMGADIWGLNDAMKTVSMIPTNPPVEPNPNIDAFLAMIRYAEGTSGPLGYQTIFGYRYFDSFADHPREEVTANGYTSDAAGAYQFLSTTWDDVARRINAPDFSPQWQDVAAVQRIIDRGAIYDVLNGNFDAAIDKLNDEWASLPGSPYGQPTRSLSQVKNVYLANGGFIA